MKYLIALLLLLIALPSYAQQLNPPGVSGTQGTGVFGNLSAGPGNISIIGNTPSSVITNVSVNGVLNVMAYGATGNGTTDDTVPIQNALTAGIQQKKCVYIPAGTYNVTQDLNLASPGPVINTPCVYGDSAALSVIRCNDLGGACMDLTGSDGYFLANFQLSAVNAGTAPKVMLLSARGQYQNQPMADGFGYELRSIWLTVSNSVTKYTWYNYGAEVAMVDNCRFGTNGAYGTQVVISSTNTAGITSKYATIVSPVPPVSTAWSTSMSVVNFINGAIAVSTSSGQPQNCAVLFDDQQPPGAPAGTYETIHDISFHGTFLGESQGGGYAFCDSLNSGQTNVTLDHINLEDIRMEASDNATTYGILNLSHSSLDNINLRSVQMSTGAPQTVPTVNFGYLNDSYIEVWPSGGGMAVNTYVISGSGARGVIFRGIAESLIAPALLNINNDAASSGNIIQWFDGTRGQLDAAGYASPAYPASLTGTSGGNVWYSMPVRANYNRRVSLQFVNYENTTATAQVIAYPFPFSANPAAIGTCPAGLVLTNNAQVSLPASMSATFSGQCFIEGW